MHFSEEQLDTIREALNAAAEAADSEADSVSSGLGIAGEGLRESLRNASTRYSALADLIAHHVSDFRPIGGRYSRPV